MAFGDSVKAAAKAAENNKSKSAAFSNVPVYVPLKKGVVTLRLFPEDVIMWKEYWMEIPVTRKDENGNEKTSIEKRPLILAVFNALDEEWENAESGYDPVSQMLYNQSEEDRKKNYAKTRFAMNVLNRTLGKTNDDGAFIPHEDGSPWNVVQVLSQSASVKSTGKDFLSDLITVAQSMRGSNGKPIQPHEGDIQVITTGEKFNEIKRTVLPSYNQEPVDFSKFVRYDLEAFYKPYPFEMLQDIIDGAEWNETRERYGISAFPSKEVQEEDLPF